MPVLGEAFAVVSQKIFWIAFAQFLLVRPVLHALPSVRLGYWILNLAVSSMMTMLALALLLVLPLIALDYMPIPREPELRKAYLWGLIAGGLATHLLWAALIKLSILKRHHNASSAR